MSEERWPVPPSWQWTTAGDVAKIVGGGTPSTKVDGNFAENGIPWITPADLTGYQESRISRGKRDLSKQGFASSGAQMLPAGSVLFSSRAPIGYCVIASHEVSTNQGFKSLVLEGEIDPCYVRHYLLSAKDYAESKASGTTFMELSGARVAELAVPVAPLPEQQRIATKVDGLTARTARARKELDRVPALIARYKQRLLALLYSEFESTSALEHLPFSEVVDSAQNGISKRRGDTGRLMNVLRLADLTDGHFVGEDPREIMLTAAEEAKYGLETDDLVCIRVNGSEKLVGRMLAWKGQPNWAFCDHFIRFKINSVLCLSKYISYFFASDVVRAQIEASFVSSAGQKTVSQGTLSKILVPVPPLEEQAEIVRRIESAFGWLDRVAADHAAAARLLPKLDAAILAKAFRGELVPQDPRDEPASALLERIAAARNSAAEKPKRGRGHPRRNVYLEGDGSVAGDAGYGVPNRPSAATQKVRFMTKSRRDDDVMGKPYLAGKLKSLGKSDVQSLFRAADLPVADFYKQLAWEIGEGHIRDSDEELKAA